VFLLFFIFLIIEFDNSIIKPIIKMRTLKLNSFLILSFSILNISFSQAPSSNDKSPEFDWNLSVSGGITHNYDDRLIDHTSLSYLEYGIGYLLNPTHEIGIKIGRNEFFSPGPLSVIGLQFTSTDTIAIYGSHPGLDPDIWYGLYYRFNYHSWFGSILAGATSGFLYEYSSISIGREIQLTNWFYLNAGLNYALKTHKYSSIRAKQLTLSASLSIKL
jgi:hypothetical protein